MSVLLPVRLIPARVRKQTSFGQLRDLIPEMKCSHCKKKSHLEFKCGCGGVFCTRCRIPEVHGCSAKEGEKVILVKVVAEKVEKL